MKINEVIEQQQYTDEGALANAMKLMLPKFAADWIIQRAHQGQYQKLLQVYQQIMQDKINPPATPAEALHRAASVVGLPDREVYAMFGDKGLKGQF